MFFLLNFRVVFRLELDTFNAYLKLKARAGFPRLVCTQTCRHWGVPDGHLYRVFAGSRGQCVAVRGPAGTLLTVRTRRLCDQTLQVNHSGRIITDHTKVSDYIHYYYQPHTYFLNKNTFARMKLFKSNFFLQLKNSIPCVRVFFFSKMYFIFLILG